MSNYQSSMPRTSAWLRGTLVCCQHADLARARLNHPTMQQLRGAIQIIGNSMNDVQWMNECDPHGKLKEVLRTLIDITSSH